MHIALLILKIDDIQISIYHLFYVMINWLHIHLVFVIQRRYSYHLTSLLYILRDLLPRNFNLVAYSENHYQRKTWTSNRKVGKINWKSKILKSLSLSWYILLRKCNTRFYADLLKKIIYLLSFSFLRKESESFFYKNAMKNKADIIKKCI